MNIEYPISNFYFIIQYSVFIIHYSILIFLLSDFPDFRTFGLKNYFPSNTANLPS